MTQHICDETDLIALRFLQKYGPHTMGAIDGSEAFAAAWVFRTLRRAGLVSKTDFGNGRVQFALTPAGLQTLSAQGAAH